MAPLAEIIIYKYKLSQSVNNDVLLVFALFPNSIVKIVQALSCQKQVFIAHLLPLNFIFFKFLFSISNSSKNRNNSLIRAGCISELNRKESKENYAKKYKRVWTIILCILCGKKIRDAPVFPVIAWHHKIIYLDAGFSNSPLT